MTKKIITVSLFSLLLAMSFVEVIFAQGAPTISGISPSSGARGQTLTVGATGNNFPVGAGGSCSVAPTGAGITAGACTIVSTTSLSFPVTITSAAAPGTRTLAITFPAVAAQNFSFIVSAGEAAPETIPLTVRTGAEFVALLETIVNWIFVVLLVVAVIFIVLAAWQFITGGGELQQVSQARQKLLYAAIGIIVALLSRGIVAAIRNIVGA